MAEEQTKEPEQELRYLVRVANTDLKGEQQLCNGLTKIKGVSHMLSNCLCKLSQIDPRIKVGTISDAHIERIEGILADPLANGVPLWMLNRRKDVETGKDMHLLGGDLKFTKDNDLKRLMKTRSYKGFRHAVGLPLRGQRTKSNFRKSKSRGKGGLGVKKKGGKK